MLTLSKKYLSWKEICCKGMHESIALIQAYWLIWNFALCLCDYLRLRESSLPVGDPDFFNS